MENIKYKDDKTNRELKNRKIFRSIDFNDGMETAMQGHILSNREINNGTRDFLVGYRELMKSCKHRNEQALGKERAQGLGSAS